MAAEWKVPEKYTGYPDHVPSPEDTADNPAAVWRAVGSNPETRQEMNK